MGAGLRVRAWQVKTLSKVLLPTLATATCSTVFPALCSGLADVVRNSKRLAQLAQQGAGELWAVVNESVLVLRYPLSCLKLCPWEHLRSMPATQQQHYKALWQFFLTAGPQLLLGALVAERGNADLAKRSYLLGLALGLQPGTAILLQLPPPALLKRTERSSEQASVGRLLDALELAASEGRIDGERAAAVRVNGSVPSHSMQCVCERPVEVGVNGSVGRCAVSRIVVCGVVSAQLSWTAALGALMPDLHYITNI